MEKINVTKSFLPPIEEYKKILERIWENNIMTNNGPIHNELEEKLTKYLKVKNANLFTNGHLALEAAIEIMGLKGEVITTPFTFASTIHAIIRCGLKPVFCDIKLDDFTIDANKIEELINKNTVAIIPVHVFGYPCDVFKIKELAEKYDLKVIYDAAHAFGVELNNIGIGEYGDISMYSLHATKIFNTIEGGVLTYNEFKYKKVLKQIKNFGIAGTECIESIGGNAKMNEFQAAMGLINLKYIDKEIIMRKKISKIYKEKLKKIKGIKLPCELENVKHNYSYFPILINEKKCCINRDELDQELKKVNIIPRKYFFPLATDFYCYKGFYEDSHLKNAKYVAERILNLPIYGNLSEGECKYICEKIEEIILKYKKVGKNVR